MTLLIFITNEAAAWYSYHLLLTVRPSNCKALKNVTHLRIILEKPSLFCSPSQTFVILTNPKLAPYNRLDKSLIIISHRFVNYRLSSVKSLRVNSD